LSKVVEGIAKRAGGSQMTACPVKYLVALTSNSIMEVNATR